MKITIGHVALSRFRPEDTDDLYRIRNHPSIRQYMANPAPLAYDAHVEWVRRNLVEGRDLVLFLVRFEGEPVGFTLLRLVGDGTAEIGVMFQEAAKYRIVPAYAALATLSCAFSELRVTGLISYALPAHERARALNRAFGAREVESDKPGMIKFAMSREVGLANPSYVKLMARLRDRMQVTREVVPPPEISRPE